MTEEKELKTLREIKPSPKERTSVNALGFSPDGKTLLSATWNDETLLWDVPNWKVRAQVALPNKSARSTSVSFSPDGQFFVLGDFIYPPGGYETESGKPAERFQGLFKAGTPCVAFFPDGKRLAIDGPHREARLVPVPMDK